MREEPHCAYRKVPVFRSSRELTIKLAWEFLSIRGNHSDFLSDDQLHSDSTLLRRTA